MRHWITGIAGAIVITFGLGCMAIGTVDAATPRSTYGTTVGPNPWNYTMTNPDKTKDGMVLNGTPNSLAQIFLVKDPYGAPIFAVGHVGGATVFGDHFRLVGDAGFSTPVFDVDEHGTVTLLGSAPRIKIGNETLTEADIKWIHDHE